MPYWEKLDESIKVTDEDVLKWEIEYTDWKIEEARRVLQSLTEYRDKLSTKGATAIGWIEWSRGQAEIQKRYEGFLRRLKII